MIGFNGGKLCGLELTSINNYELIKVIKNVLLGRQKLLHRLEPQQTGSDDECGRNMQELH